MNDTTKKRRRAPWHHRIQVIHNPAFTAPSEIVSYLHCGKCIAELPPDKSPQEYAALEVGITSDGGFQVWCKRHNSNVTHATFLIVEQPNTPKRSKPNENA